jgi:methyl-accepting chemotaxis protein
VKFRRSILIIDRKFQLRFAVYVCSWLFALSFVYPLIINTLFDFFVRSALLDPNGQAAKTLHHVQIEVFWLLALLQVVFLIITFMNSLFMSHRICGPLYKLRKHFERVKAGDLKGQLSFRGKDYFKDLAEDFNQMVDGLRTRATRGQDQFDEIAQELQSLQASTDPEVSARLQRVQDLLKDAREQLPQ